MCVMNIGIRYENDEDVEDRYILRKIGINEFILRDHIYRSDVKCARNVCHNWIVGMLNDDVLKNEETVIKSARNWGLKRSHPCYGCSPQLPSEIRIR